MTVSSQLFVFQRATYSSITSWKFEAENLRRQISFEKWYCHIFPGPFISSVFGCFSFISYFLLRQSVSLPSFYLLSPVCLITTRLPSFSLLAVFPLYLYFFGRSVSQILTTFLSYVPLSKVSCICYSNAHLSSVSEYFLRCPVIYYYVSLCCHLFAEIPL